jgi:DNA-binding NarL/FixJ family response regulator
MVDIKSIIVDDEKEARDRLSELLKKIEGVVILCSEGDPGIAIRKIIKLKPDIVFLDIEMPGMNGFEVVHEVRSNLVYPTFIFVTGYDQYTIKAIKNSAFDYLLKPIDIDELKESLERYRKEKKLKLDPETIRSKFQNTPLTDREIEIIQLLIRGKTSKEIAEELFISKNTVDTHRRNILEKTNLNTTAELIGLCLQ